MLANGLSKAEGEEIENALKAIAEEISRRDLENVTSQHLAMLVNGLSKVEGEEIGNALKSIAKEVNWRGLKNFTSQHLAMLANGLSKVEGEEIENTLKLIAEEITQRDLKDFKSQYLAILLFAFTQRGFYKLSAYDSLVRAMSHVLEDSQSVISTKSLTQLLQVHLALHYLAPAQCQKISTQAVSRINKFEREFAAQVPSSSNLHRDVSEQLRRVYPNKTILNEQHLGVTFLDIEIPSMKIAIAVNGPSHYIKGTHTSKLDSQFLEELTAKMLKKKGCKFLVLPYWEWNQLRTDEEKKVYLQKLTLGIVKK